MEINIIVSKNYEYPDLSNISNEVLEQKFCLTKEELVFVNKVKEKYNRLGFAVFLKTFRYLGYFINDLSKVPLNIVSMLAAQLDIDAESIRRYNKLNSVKGYHIKLIKKYYGIYTFDADSKELIFKWLLEQFKITSDYDNIVRSCIQMIKSEHKELPSLNVIESLVDLASESMNKEFYDYFDKNLTLIQKNRMNELVKKLPENKRKSEFSLLKYIPGKPNIVTLSKHIKMQSRLKEFQLSEKIMERLKNWLHNTWEKFNSSYNQNRYIRIKSGKLSITPLDREKQPPRLNYIKLKIFEAIGDVDITDILMDVQLMTNFCSNFRHMGGWKKDSLKVSNEKLLATMHSVGCNLGPAQTKKSTIFSEKQITNTRNSFFSERNITNAKNQIVNVFSRLRITNNWGDGSSVSADGRLIKMSDKNLMASWNVKYHGIGGMLYTHVSDKYIAIYSQFIHCGVYEAEYILDAIFNEEKIDIKPYKIHADTHGQTEMVFAFCFLLGIQLMPRIRNIKDYTLCKPDPSSKYKYVDSLASKPIDWHKIYSQSDQMLRLCATIRKGKVRSSICA